MCPGQMGHKMQRIEALANAADIIIITYQQLESERKMLQRVWWDRVVLDEMQEVRSSTTVLAKACEALKCDRRWMVWPPFRPFLVAAPFFTTTAALFECHCSAGQLFFYMFDHLIVRFPSPPYSLRRSPLRLISLYLSPPHTHAHTTIPPSIF